MCKSMIVPLIIISVAVTQISCDESVTNNYVPVGAALDDNSAPHSVVTNNPATIISYSDMMSVQKGAIMKLRVNRNELEVWEVDVVFDALYTEGADRLILCHTKGDFPVGGGDSGSPLLTSDGRVAGILCYGYSGNSTDFCARAIEDVLSITTGAVSRPASSKVFNLIQPVYIVSGYNAQAASRYSLLGDLLGNYTIQTEQPFKRGNTLSKIVANPVIPGSSIAVMFVSGDYINEIAVGTMSYVNNGTDFAFGHSYRPFLAAPTYLAANKSFITAVDESFKMAEPTQQLVGSVVRDDFNGILIKENVSPLVANVATSCSIDGQSAFLYHHQISNTQSFGYDRDLAANLSCYLLYLKIADQNRLQDSAVATCSLQIMTEQEIKNATFVLHNWYIDQYVYYYILDSVQTLNSNKELKRFDLSIDLRY